MMYLYFKNIIESCILTSKFCELSLDILYKQKINNQISRYIDDIKFIHKTEGLDYLKELM